MFRRAAEVNAASLKSKSKKATKAKHLNTSIFKHVLRIFSCSNHWARSVQKQLWPDECLTVRPFAGGERAHDAALDGQQVWCWIKSDKKAFLITCLTSALEHINTVHYVFVIAWYSAWYTDCIAYCVIA